LLAIVTTFGVGTAFETTGLANHIATGLISVFGSLGTIGVLLSVAVVTSVVGCAVSNNAVVILMYPICQTLARDFEGVGLRQLLVVLLVNASSSFLTPMGYQTNLMVYGPGRYRFFDIAKYGAGLTLIMSLIVPALIILNFK
jgi:di/tricarboxylate transporter